MRESTKMLLHYVTGLLIIVTGLIHLLANNEPNVGKLITGNTYLYLSNMAIFLAALLYHAFNGIRVILIELVPDKCWTKLIGWTIFLIGIVTYIVGFQVLLMALGLI
jgi:succinate dehydrogenase hydrophobic anchor subunit